MSKIETGDIIFVRGNGILSKLVRFFDKGEFSHVAIAVSDTHILEANWNIRSKITKMEYTDYEVIRLKDITQEQKDMIPELAKSLQGRWYDYFQILGILMKSRINSPQQLICSEIVYMILLGIGYEDDVTLLDSTPNMMWNKLKNK